MIDLLRNVAINIKATGPAAVMIAWIAAVAALGIFGSPELGKSAMYALYFAGGPILTSLASKV